MAYTPKVKSTVKSSSVVVKKSTHGTGSVVGKQYSENTRGTIKVNALSFMSIIFLLIFVVVIVSTLTGFVRVPTFTGLLNYLTSAPQINMSIISQGISSFIDSVTSIPIIGGGLAFIAKPISVVVYLAICVINAVLFIGWFVGWIFGF